MRHLISKITIIFPAPAGVIRSCINILRIFQVKTKGNPVWFERRNTDKINILLQRNIKMYSSVLSYRIEYVSMKE